MHDKESWIKLAENQLKYLREEADDLEHSIERLKSIPEDSNWYLFDKKVRQIIRDENRELESEIIEYGIRKFLS